MEGFAFDVEQVRHELSWAAEEKIGEVDHDGITSRPPLYALPPPHENTPPGEGNYSPLLR